MRVLATCSAALLAVAWCGCASTPQQHATEIRPQQTETVRVDCERALRDERARTTAAEERWRSEQRKLTAAEAEINALRSRNQSLKQQNDEIVALLDKRTREPLERPAVPATLLPAETDAALQRFASKYQNRVWYDRGRGALSFANDRLFDSGSDAVRPDAQAALHELAGIAAGTLPAQYELILIGHTDNTPIRKDATLAQHPTNWHLSVHRAIAVKDVLTKAGLSADRLGVMGYGSQRPLGDDRARNRRVEIFFVRKGALQPFGVVQPPIR